ncbi:LYR motif-containing protein, partial [Euroglyphus maynei]
LLYYGRDYPLGYKYFRDRCHKAFVKNRDETDPQQIQKHISRGEFIIKELEALYRLRKYRYLKQRYYPEKSDDDDDLAGKIDPKLMLKKFEAKTISQQQQSSPSSSSPTESIKEEIKQ